MKAPNLFLAFFGAFALFSCSSPASPQVFTLSNESGMEVKITNFGARVMSVTVPDRDGVKRDVVLGFDDPQSYFPENNQTDFGAAIGRYANRIQNGRFTLDGADYQLPQNNFGHCLHGGPDGWQYRLFSVVKSSPSELVLQIESPDGDMGFPGKVTATVSYTLTQGNSLDILYRASSDAPTIINMTNHSYFNLSGDPANHSICDDILYINASRYTPVDSTFMTTGEILPVEGTPLDFTSPRRIGERIDETSFAQIANGDGYDHNWVLDTEGDSHFAAAKLYCPSTGIALSVYTDEPGVQVYSGNFLDGTVTGKGGVVYNRRSAICLETQHYPDSPNKSDWPSVVLRPGQSYQSFCSFAFTIE